MKNKILNSLSLVSSLGIIGWIITDSFGGMIIYALDYTYLILPIILVYIVTFLITLFKVINKGLLKNRFISVSHGTVILFAMSYGLISSELLKSKTILDATLMDDLSGINIIFRSDNSFKTTSFGMFGFVDRYKGEYKLDEDTIVFFNKRYSNDFIPDTLLISIKDSALFFNKNSLGEFNKEKSFVNYFEIHKIEL